MWPTIAALPPSGSGGTQWKYKVDTDGLQKVQLNARSQDGPGMFRLKLKSKRWFTAAQANRPRGATILTVQIGAQCFSRAATKKVD